MCFDPDEHLSRAPLLRAGGLSLVPFSGRHLTANYVAWLNDPTVVRFSENRHRVHTLDSCIAYVTEFRTSPHLLWAVELADGTHIGNVGASFDLVNQIADIGILLGHAQARGKGHGLEVWTCVLAYLAGREDVAKVTGGCLSTNTAMVRIMENAGMVPDGVRLQHYLWEGQRVDLIYRALIPVRAGCGQ